MNSLERLGHALFAAAIAAMLTAMFTSTSARREEEIFWAVYSYWDELAQKHVK